MTRNRNRRNNNVNSSTANANLPPRRRTQRRRRGRRNQRGMQGAAANSLAVSNVVNRPSYVGDFQPFITRNSADGMATRRYGKKIARLANTSAGLGFLKAAFAPTAFSDVNTLGVPDKYEGMSLGFSLNTVANVTVGGAANNNPNGIHIRVIPCVGAGFWVAPAAASSPESSAGFNNANKTVTIWGPAVTNNLPVNMNDVRRFRYISLVVEVVPITAPAALTGAIHVWKTEGGETTDVHFDSITGASTTLQQVPQKLPPISQLVNTASDGTVQYTNEPKYVGPAARGAYCVATSKDPNWPWTDITSVQAGYFPTDILDAQASAGLTERYRAQMNIPVTGTYFGCGNVENISIFISAPQPGTTAGASASYLIRTWHNIELQLSQSSPLYPFIKPSPPCDELALQAYKEMSKNSPVAVTLQHEGDYWTSLLKLVSAGASARGYPVEPSLMSTMSSLRL